MFFRRARNEDAPGGEPAPEETPPLAQAPDAVLRDEWGLYHLWYFERRLTEELGRAARREGVFSLVAWRLKLLPGETPDSEHMRQCAVLIVKRLRPYDIPARVDGRFVALLLDADHTEGSTVAYRIAGELQVRAPAAGKWRAGMATFPQDGLDGDSLIQAMLRRLDDDTRHLARRLTGPDPHAKPTTVPFDVAYPAPPSPRRVRLLAHKNRPSYSRRRRPPL